MKLPRRFSMNHRDEFHRVKQQGRTKIGRFVIVSTLIDESLEHLKTGIVTSKRSARKAHDRVLIRRRCRSLLHRHGDSFQETRRFLVVIAKSGSALADFEDFERDWLQQMKRLKIIL